MTQVSEALAQYLAQQGHGTYSLTAGGTIFPERLPQSPDEVLALFTYGGFPADSKLGYDTPSVQVFARGTKDARTAQAKLRAVYGHLHGLRGVDLPGGVRLVSCLALQSEPIRVGPDGNDRQQFSLNFLLEVRSITEHRE